MYVAHLGSPVSVAAIRPSAVQDSSSTGTVQSTHASSPGLEDETGIQSDSWIARGFLAISPSAIRSPPRKSISSPGSPPILLMKFTEVCPGRRKTATSQRRGGRNR